LAIYGEVAFGYATAKVGFIFLVVPLASWLLIAIVVPIAAFFLDGASAPHNGNSAVRTSFQMRSRRLVLPFFRLIVSLNGFSLLLVTSMQHPAQREAMREPTRKHGGKYAGIRGNIG